ncbi:MAG: SMP-30/gluconolactonase/LRE family protein [Candidatus Sericytochromatia bacterium]|nr:SMP-30/gluconolactonase/LRE family protein [Candidatus Sericytochromatia bacterium]
MGSADFQVGDASDTEHTGPDQVFVTLTISPTYSAAACLALKPSAPPATGTELPAALVEVPMSALVSDMSIPLNYVKISATPTLGPVGLHKTLMPALASPRSMTSFTDVDNEWIRLGGIVSAVFKAENGQTFPMANVNGLLTKIEYTQPYPADTAFMNGAVVGQIIITYATTAKQPRVVIRSGLFPLATITKTAFLNAANAGSSASRVVVPSGVTTLAGDGTAGFLDHVTGTLARFNFPMGVAVDAAGNLSVADLLTNRIRRVVAGGAVTTLAGNATQGYLDHVTATSAQFNNPAAVAVDAAGNVYIADRGNHRIRKMTAGGVVTTLAGDGTQGFLDHATGTSAQFNTPQGIAVDAAGNVYVGDTGNRRIRKVTAAGAVSTLAGDGTTAFLDHPTGTSAKFNSPRGVAVDAAGNVYVADEFSARIRKVTAGGAVTTLAGDGTLGSLDHATSTSARFNSPQGIAVDSAGTVYVADLGNNRIRRVTP